MTIVPAFSIVFALLFLVLSVQTIRARRVAKIALGTRGDKGLERAARVHANFAEYVPLTLLLLSFAEQRGISEGWITLLCSVFLAGRLLHAWGMSQQQENLHLRAIAILVTFATLGITAGVLVYSYMR